MPFYLLPSAIPICTTLDGSSKSIGTSYMSQVSWNDMDTTIFLVGGAYLMATDLRASSSAMVT